MKKPVARKRKYTTKPRKPQGRIEIPAMHHLLIECRDEAEQKSLYERFAGEGRKCKVLTI